MHYVVNTKYNQYVFTVHCKFQVELLGLLHAMLRKSVENLRVCTRAGLIKMLLDKISSAQDDEVVAGKFTKQVEMLLPHD